MKYEYKKGDKVRVINIDDDSHVYSGFETKVVEDLFTDNDNEYLKINDKYGNEEGYYVYKFEKIKKGKQVPEVLHIILIDSCKNLVSIEKSYKDAEVKAKNRNESVTIYKLMPVAQISSERRVKKIRGK